VTSFGFFSLQTPLRIVALHTIARNNAGYRVVLA
jgi:hypothetical protein